MEWYLAGGLLVGVICALMAVGVPVAFSFFFASIVGVLIFIGGDVGMRQLATSASGPITNFALVPIPLFLLMGELFFHTGVATRVFDAFDKLFGRMHGRLSYATVAGGTVFSALSGSSIANTALMGSSMVPEMVRRGYKPHLSMGPILGAGGLAIIIPPSALAVLLGSLAKVDIGALLIAGVIPGLVLASLYVLTIYLQLKIDPSAAPAYDVPPIPLAEKLQAIFLNLLPMGIIIFMVIGLMLLGVATPTEASAFGVLAVLIVAAIYRRLTWEAVRKSLIGALKTTTMVFLIIVASTSFSQSLALSGATAGLVKWTSGFELSPMLTLAMIISIVILLGCLMDQVAIMMLTVPLFYPIVAQMNMDPIWFSVMFMLALETGLITPPFGMALFVLHGVAGTDFKTIMKAGIPYVFCTFTLIVLIALMPPIATWLPSLLD
jgi:tripartite ATP-independent transporter DctM subunit